MNRSPSFEALPIAAQASLPLRERILDRLADLMFAADELLDLIRTEEGMRFEAVASRVQHVYDEVNDMMKQLCD